MASSTYKALLQKRLYFPDDMVSPWSEEGSTHRMGEGMRPASENRYSILDQNLIFPTLFMT